MDLPDPGRYFDEHGAPADEQTPPWVIDETSARRWDLCLGIAAQHAGIADVDEANRDIDARAFAKALFESDAPTSAPAQ